MLEIKTDGEILRGLMAVLWTGHDHSTPNVVDQKRDYGAIYRAGAIARSAVWRQDVRVLAEAIKASYSVQQGEGMDPLAKDIPGALAWKYCGGGFGGYAMYLFGDQKARDQACERPGMRPVEPYQVSRSR